MEAGYVKETGYCRFLATNYEQDIDFQDKEGMFNRMTCLVGWNWKSGIKLFLSQCSFTRSKILAKVEGVGL